MKDDTEYPSWKKAILGNDHAANLYCGVKYVLWHSAHVLLAAVLLIGAASGKAFRALKPNDRKPPSVNLGERLTEPRAKASSRIAVVVFAVAVTAFLVHTLLTDPILFALLIAEIVIIVVIGLLIVRYDEKIVSVIDKIFGTVGNVEEGAIQKGSNIKKKSEKTPVARRIVGYCPVSMDIDPKWFEEFEERIYGKE